MGQTQEKDSKGGYSSGSMRLEKKVGKVIEPRFGEQAKSGEGTRGRQKGGVIWTRGKVISKQVTV